jgi:hypothetical protein
MNIFSSVFLIISISSAILVYIHLWVKDIINNDDDN